MGRYDIALLGGDARIGYMYPCFVEMGYRVICYGTAKITEENPASVIWAGSWEEAIKEANCIVGGIPLMKNGKLCCSQDLSGMTEEQMYRWVRAGQTVFGGVLSDEFIGECTRRKVCCHDFMRDEALAVFNAVATAEGAILEALKNQETNIHGSRSLVLGYGKCGRVLAEKLKGLGAEVTVCSRCRVELAAAETFCMTPLPLEELEEKIGEYEYVYNTIPAVVLSCDILRRMRRDVLIIDIASGTGGVDYACADKFKLHALHCLGLPGKYAPKISAKGLADFVVHKIVGNCETLVF